MLKKNSTSEFYIYDYTLLALSEGKQAQTLRELCQGIKSVSEESIHYHFWRRLLHPQFQQLDYNNDFATWAYHTLNDEPLAERLSILNPLDFNDIGALRTSLVEIVEERIEEKETFRWADKNQLFQFIRSQTSVFNTRIKAENPESLIEILSKMSDGSLFYHFIDSRQRNPEKCNDFELWLMKFSNKHLDLVYEIRKIDPYFTSIKKIRNNLLTLFKEYFQGVNFV